MNEQFELTAKKRENGGTSVARRLRREDQIPAIVYGAGKPSTPITMAHKDIFHALEKEAFYSHVLDLTIDGNTEKVVLKNVQRHVYKPKIQHVDFLRVDEKAELTMNVPLHFINEEKCAGVKAGGLASKLITDIEVRCLPSQLPEFIEVDVTDLEIESALHLSDITLPEGVSFTGAKLDDSHNQPIYSVHKPKGTADTDDEESSTDADTSAESADKA